jgi:ribonucleotide reductase beta subunit family protein with ferritin-like domain
MQCSELTKEKISQNKKKLYESEIEREKQWKAQGIPVSQYDENMNLIAEYYSYNHAARVTKINRKMIAKCCKNIISSYKSFIWKFKNENI